MMLWIVLFLCLVAAIGFSILPLLREQPNSKEFDSRQNLYQNQIDEIEAEAENGIITADEAAALRVEAQRRLLEASDKATPDLVMSPLPRTGAAIFLAGLLAIGVGLYGFLGNPSLKSSRPAQITDPAPTASVSNDQIDIMINQLSERLSAEPNDKEGWRILALSYVGRQKYADAAEAYRRLTELEPDNPDHLSAYGETLVMAANGHVNNEAQAVFDSVMKLDPNDPRARFFRGMTLDQAGETRAALDIWIDIVNTAPPGSGWVVDIRRQIEERAQEAGIDISGQLKKAAPAPSQQQIDDAMAMPEQDREAMIQNMVDGLADRLAENPNDPDGWIRLINARVVLGQDEQAKQALIGALEVFNNKPEIRNRIVEAAKSRNISIE